MEIKEILNEDIRFREKIQQAIRSYLWNNDNEEVTLNVLQEAVYKQIGKKNNIEK